MAADPDGLLLVAEEGDAVVGHVLASNHPTLFANAPVCWVEELMTTADRRRQGTASYATIGYEASATFHRKRLTSGS